MSERQSRSPVVEMVGTRKYADDDGVSDDPRCSFGAAFGGDLRFRGQFTRDLVCVIKASASILLLAPS